MCDRSGCNVDPEWRPVIMFRADKSPNVCRGVLGLKVCGMCKARLKLADVLTDQGLEQVARKFVAEGKDPPLREFTWLDFVGINSKSAKEAEAKEEKLRIPARTSS